MEIVVVGGGPAGLYFALLMKARNPQHQVRVIEQNPAGATYGWGVVFSDTALTYLEEADASSYQDIAAVLQYWDDQVLVHRGEAIRIDGLKYSGIARLELLRILQRHCRRQGVDLLFEQRIDSRSSLRGYDLLVGADGVNSIVREWYAEHFQPHVRTLSNKYVWYGTDQPFEALTLTFRQNDAGVFVAHHYPYSKERSTFIVECDARTWERAGFGSMSEEQSRRYCEAVFEPELQGHQLLTNKSVWLNFRVVTNKVWSYRNVVLLGDALRTVHFSVGSGTRMAMGDAIALARAFDADGDVPAALARFERDHRPPVESFLEVAASSFRWYERFREKMPLDPLPFAYDYVMRSGRITPERLRQHSPAFAAAYERYTGKIRS